MCDAEGSVDIGGTKMTALVVEEPVLLWLRERVGICKLIVFVGDG